MGRSAFADQGDLISKLCPQHYHGVTITRLSEELPEGAKPYKTRNGAFHVNAKRLAAHHTGHDHHDGDGDGDGDQPGDDTE
ncbi:MAG: hypothetical protein ACRDRH_29125 [Pseudonocardia sp.]